MDAFRHFRVAGEEAVLRCEDVRQLQAVFGHTDRLVFVTNQMCSDLAEGHDETKFDTAAASNIESFRKRLKEQDPDFLEDHSNPSSTSVAPL